MHWSVRLGNFNLAFTDLSIPVSGIPITITRTYDTLRAHQPGDFGYGWRLSTGDMKVAVEYAPGPMSEFSVFPRFRDGTRVTVTREDGSTEGFTFQPIEIPFLTISYFQPYFAPDAGVTSRLEVTPWLLQRMGDEYLVPDAGFIGYHPADPAGGCHLALENRPRSGAQNQQPTVVQ